MTGVQTCALPILDVSRGPWPPKVLAYLVILCLEKQHPTQKTVARLKSDFPRKKSFGLATPLVGVKSQPLTVSVDVRQQCVLSALLFIF